MILPHLRSCPTSLYVCLNKNHVVLIKILGTRIKIRKKNVLTQKKRLPCRKKN